MKSKLDSLVAQLKKAVKKLEEVMKKKKDEYIRDSAIQRFEFTFELAWKTMKAYLEEKGARDLYSPKEVIRSAFQARLVPNNPRWLEMVDTRNMTSHIYSEALADKVYRRIPRYVPLLKKFVEDLG